MTVNFALTILVLIPLPFIGIGNYIIGKELRKFSKEKQESIASMTSFVRESIDGIRVLKAFTQESGNNKEYDKLNTYFYNKNMKVIKLAALSRPLVSLVLWNKYYVFIRFWRLLQPYRRNIIRRYSSTYSIYFIIDMANEIYRSICECYIN